MLLKTTTDLTNKSDDSVAGQILSRLGLRDKIVTRLTSVQGLENLKSSDLLVRSKKMYHRVVFNPATGRHVVLKNLYVDTYGLSNAVKAGLFKSLRQAYIVCKKMNRGKEERT